MSSRTRYFNRYTPYRSGIAARASRQQRAADQQRDSTSVVVNTNVSFDCGQTMNEIYKQRGDSGWFDTGCMAINIFDVLKSSEYFQSFSTLYDQVKIDNVRAKIIATNWATSREANDEQKINEIIKARSYVIVTAWDRSGLSKDQIKFDENWDNGVQNKKFYCTIGKNIESYSSAKTKHLGPGNAYEIVRQLYPENLYERSQFVSTGLLKSQQKRVNTEFFPYNCFYKKVVPETVNANGYVYEAYDFDTKYPTNLISDPSVPFKPTLLINVISGPTPYVTNIKEKDPEGFYTLLTVGVNKIKPVTFDVEFEVVCTFRGLRYNRNVDTIKNIQRLAIKPWYPIDNSKTKSPPENEKWNIQNIFVADSQYNNSQLLDAQFSFGGSITRDALPDSSKNRYVVYLSDPGNSDESTNDPNKIYIINYGNGRFSKTFNDHEVFLMDFISDAYKTTEADNKNYINIQMRRTNPTSGNQPKICMEKSIKLSVPITPYNSNTNEIGKNICDAPKDYVFKWVGNQPNDDHMNVDPSQPAEHD